jgi:hypothetical protein
LNVVNEDQKCGVSGGGKPDQMDEEYPAASFSELLRT